MRLEGQEESENVEDERSFSPRGVVIGHGNVVGVIRIELTGHQLTGKTAGRQSGEDGRVECAVPFAC